MWKIDHDSSKKVLIGISIKLTQPILNLLVHIFDQVDFLILEFLHFCPEFLLFMIPALPQLVVLLVLSFLLFQNFLFFLRQSSLLRLKSISFLPHLTCQSFKHIQLRCLLFRIRLFPGLLLSISLLPLIFFLLDLLQPCLIFLLLLLDPLFFLLL